MGAVIKWTWSVWWRDGFLRIFTLAFDGYCRLGQITVNDCPAVLENWLTACTEQGLEEVEKLVMKYECTKPTRSIYSPIANINDFFPQDEDEKDLVGNEEEQAEEIEEAAKNEEFKGKIHYRLEYDFTTQELKVTVSHLQDF